MFKLTSIKSGFAENGSIRTTISRNYRGILVCIFGGMASMWLSEHYATPVMLIALLLGLAMNFLNDDVRIRPGILWVAKGLLRIGVGLLGLRILFTQIVAEGIAGPAIVITAMLMTFLTGALIAKLMNLNSSFARLSAGSVAVCGVSAAIAISAVLPKRKNADNELAVVIITVTVLSTLAMIIYPIIAKQLAFDDTAAGIFMGGSIHDVAQVVGAGFSISETAGDTATYIKLMRVALLLPIVLIIGLLSRGETDLADRPPLLPGF
ncbi:MAG: putative sulfate exporter family transporter, partial [Litorimonas sp.]